jgi:hypothetical protein
MFPTIDREFELVQVASLAANTRLNGTVFLHEAAKLLPCRIHAIAQRSAGGMPAKRGSAGGPRHDLPTRPVGRDRRPEIKTFFGGHSFDRVGGRALQRPCRCALRKIARRWHRASPHLARQRG